MVGAWMLMSAADLRKVLGRTAHDLEDMMPEFASLFSSPTIVKASVPGLFDRAPSYDHLTHLSLNAGKKKDSSKRVNLDDMVDDAEDQVSSHVCCLGGFAHSSLGKVRR